MAGDQLQLNLPDVINSQFGGGRVQQVNSDGSANVQVSDKDGNSQVIKFDPIAYSKANGIDPQKVKVQYNSPETALDENPIGFKDGIMMALADKKANTEFLKGKYGDDSVMPGPDGSFLVNDNGAWKKADPGFLAKMASNIPEMASFGPGEVAGAALGTAIAGPLGTIPGGIAGGALAASLASLVKNKGVESLGLRTESDAASAAKEFGHDMVNNLIWGTLLKPVEGLAKAGGSLVAGAGRKLLGSVDKEGLAATAEKLLPGTSATDWSAVVRSPEDAQAVQDGLKQMAAYGQKAANSVVKGPDPMIQGMTSTMMDFMDSAKSSAEDMYGTMWNALDEAGVTKAPVQVADSATGLKSDMISMGLLEKDVEGNLRFNPKPQSEDAERILQVFDPKSRNTIKQVFDQVTNVAKDGGEISFGKAKMLIGGVDDILENSGFYNNGENALSNNVRRSLSKFREGLSNNLADGIKDQVVTKGGVAENALNYFNEVNSKYSQYKSVMNDFSMNSKFGGDMSQQAATIEKMLGDKGYGLEQNFVKLAGAVGKDAEPVLQSLQQQRAARNLSDIYSPQKGIASWMKETVTGGPRDWANRMAQRTQTSAKYAEQWNESLMSKIPASGASKALVDATARGANFINTMGGQDKMSLITNPQALRSFVNAMVTTPQTQQTVMGQLMKQAMDSVQGPQNGQ